MVKRHNHLMLTLLALSDLMAAAGAWAITYGLGRWRSPEAPTFIQLLPMFIPALALCVPIYSRFGLYEPRRTKQLWMELSGVFRAVFSAWCLTYVIAMLMKEAHASRFTMLQSLSAWMVLAASSRIVGRKILHYFRSRGYNLRRAAIIGTGRLGQTLFHTLKRNAWIGIEPTYFVYSGQSRPLLYGLDVVGPVENLEQIIAARRVDVVFVALPAGDHSKVADVLDKLVNTELDVRVVPDMLSFHFLRHDFSQFDNLPVVTLTHTPLGGWNGVLKRIFDVTVAGIALIALAIPMLLLALVVRLTSKGPVFYRQVRTSLGGAPFDIIKFRTMVVNAEKGTGPMWAADHDPRVTPVGAFLRSSGLDELPQLLNVIKGDMSLVGPRPERPELIERFRKQIPRYMLRHHARAGVTGWAQMNGLRGRTSLRKRVQYDMFYVCNWSLLFDLRIIAATAIQLLIPPLRRRVEAAARELCPEEPRFSHLHEDPKPVRSYVAEPLNTGG